MGVLEYDGAQPGVGQKDWPGELIPVLGLEVGVGQASRSWPLSRRDISLRQRYQHMKKYNNRDNMTWCGMSWVGERVCFSSWSWTRPEQ